MAKNEATRRAAEDALAKEHPGPRRAGASRCTDRRHGGGRSKNQGRARKKRSRRCCRHAAPSAASRRSAPPRTAGPSYAGFYGGYDGYGWGHRMEAARSTHTDRERRDARVLAQAKQAGLGGQSETTNPSQVDNFVRELANATAEEKCKSRVSSGLPGARGQEPGSWCA